MRCYYRKGMVEGHDHCNLESGVCLEELGDKCAIHEADEKDDKEDN